MKRLIVFEGVDFCGKTTQMDYAEEFLKSKWRNVVRFREPGGTTTGERIRDLLLDKERVEMRPKTELLLFFASRVQLLEEKVLPALADGMIVLLDRYYYSTAAYQGPFMEGYGANWVTSLAEDWLRLTEPDLVIYLDGDPEKLAPRKVGEKDRFEARGVKFQEKVRATYLAMADHRQEIFRVVNAERPVEEIRREIETILSREVA
jgi:dTMP kinase